MSLDVKEALAKGRTVYVPNGDGTVTFTKPDGESWTVGNPAEEAEEATVYQSAAAAELAEIRRRRGSLIEPFECGGKTWYLLRMNGAQIRQVGILMSRAGDGTLMLTSDDQLVALMCAALQVGVVQGSGNPEPYWNPEPMLMEDMYGRPCTTTLCEQYVMEPETDDTTALLFDRLTDMNPRIWPGKPLAKKKGAEILGLNSTPTASSNGSESAETAPDSSPTGSES
jgi:hypothetical protein